MVLLLGKPTTHHLLLGRSQDCPDNLSGPWTHHWPCALLLKHTKQMQICSTGSQIFIINLLVTQTHAQIFTWAVGQSCKRLQCTLLNFAAADYAPANLSAISRRRDAAADLQHRYNCRNYWIWRTGHDVRGLKKEARQRLELVQFKKKANDPLVWLKNHHVCDLWCVCQTDTDHRDAGGFTLQMLHHWQRIWTKFTQESTCLTTVCPSYFPHSMFYQWLPVERDQ